MIAVVFVKISCLKCVLKVKNSFIRDSLLRFACHSMSLLDKNVAQEVLCCACVSCVGKC